MKDLVEHFDDKQETQGESYSVGDREFEITEFDTAGSTAFTS